MRAFYDEDWEEASSKFNDLRANYGQSPYATLAELRLADISFEKDSLPEAVSAYKDFTHAHREDPGVAYARFRVCQALVKQINDTVLLPPQEERDQGPTQEAYQALKGFKKAYPSTKWAKQVDYMLQDVSGRLARHELYVARFYLKMDRFDATVSRLQQALREFPDSGLEPEALLLLGETYLKMKQRDKARVVFQRAVSQYPASPFTRRCKDYLDHIPEGDGKTEELP
jgi:outer membrane protein assembly factor BamD